MLIVLLMKLFKYLFGKWYLSIIIKKINKFVCIRFYSCLKKMRILKVYRYFKLLLLLYGW